MENNSQNILSPFRFKAKIKIIINPITPKSKRSRKSPQPEAEAGGGDLGWDGRGVVLGHGHPTERRQDQV